MMTKEQMGGNVAQTVESIENGETSGNEEQTNETTRMGDTVAGITQTLEEMNREVSIEPSKDILESDQSKVSFGQLLSFADRYDYLLMLFGTIGAVVHGAALPVLFLFFGNLLNGLGGSPESVTRTVNKNAEYFVWVGLATLGSSWLEVSFWIQTGERQSAKLRTEYLKAVLRQDIAQFDADNNTGAIVNSIAADTVVVQDAIGEKIGNFLHYMSTFVVGFVVGFIDQWQIALVTLAVVPLIAAGGGVMVYTLALTSSTKKVASAYSEAGTISEQAISQVRTVYSFVSEAKIIESYSNALQKTRKLAASQGLAKGLGLGITYATLFLSWALLLWYGGVLVRNGATEGGTAMATTFSVIIGSISLGQALPNLALFAKARAAAFRIFQMINQESKINKPDESAKTLETVNGFIELRDVDFSYPTRPDVPIFKKFSLMIPSGQTVAIVGSSGSGKSTIVSLIERFYDPNAGEILLDGHDVRKLNLKWLRGQIGLVNQEPVLFATTIAANILYGNGNATTGEIVKAAQAANAHCFIESLPLGYQTQVGDKGIQLSGGQKQRVAIARAILKNPKILLLDEATSALDTDSEQVVQEALDHIMVGRTTIVVAHRLSTIRNANTIAVVQQGHIVESGTHQDLTSREDGAYSALVRLQEMAPTRDPGLTRNSSSLRSSTLSFSRRISRDIVGSSRGFHCTGRSSSFSVLHQGTKHSVASDDMDEAIKPFSNGISTLSNGSVRRLVAISMEYWKYGLSGTLASIAAGCILPAYGAILGEVLALYYYSNKNQMNKEVSKYSLIMTALALVAPVVCTLQFYSLAILGEELVKRVREKMLTSILRNDIGWFDEDENNSSQVTARLTSDSTTVRAAIGDRLSIIVQNFSMLLLSLIISFALSWKMALVMMATFPLMAVACVVEKLFLTGFVKDQAKAYARATQVAGQAVSNIRTVAAFNAEDKFLALYASELEGPARQSFWRGQVAGLGFGFSQCMMIFTYGMALWYAGTLVTTGQETFGTVVKIFIILVVAAFALAETLAMMPDLVKGGKAVDSVFEVLDRVTNIEPEDPDGMKVNKLRGDISLRNIVFTYPSRPDVVVLKSLNLTVRSGRRLALVGTSGSGKSSVIALIERFYDPTSGQVLIDGKDIKKYNLRSVRQHIALVQQEPALFATTIYENIMYGKDGASEAEVIEAAKTANAHTFISSLPNGYKTQVGERGIQLSGGQKQRVAIARAVLKDPAILLLDEATSALDSESEKIVQEALDRLMKYRTTVMIAHRLSTIRAANTIAVIQDGTILEEGSHTELVALGGGYSRLINLQSRLHESMSSSATIAKD